MTKDGDYVLNANDARNGNVNGRIQVDPTQKITVDELGNIYQNDQQVGTIGIVDFADYDYLAKYGENMYDLVNGDGGRRQDRAGNAGVVQCECCF